MTFKPIFRLLYVATVNAEFKLSCSANIFWKETFQEIIDGSKAI